MRYFLLITILLVSFAGKVSAQEAEVIQDTTIVKAPVLDSTFFKKDIFSMLQEKGPYSNKINVEQSKNVLSAFNNHIEQSSNKKINGYRIRIFFDNKQDARNHSSSVAGNFSAIHPYVPVYRTHTSPYFKVTVGDFRTKSEAIMLLKKIEADYPSAFLVKETINFPPL
ncbi:MAG: SPOR domain-containing protein [Bacteroidales bacterium]|jgi:hypothetical protein